MNNNDTICALATAPGGAIAIIRVSGNESIDIISGIFSKSLHDSKANSVHYGEIHDGEQMIDEVLVTVFRTPHSYTGEDSVEISCHGSRYIIQKILDLLVKHGCRMADPGEYTQRAFLNGKMDLSQAEAVADLIASSNRATHRLAINQLRGGFSSQLAELRGQLLRLTSLLELELDFSDHEDLEFANRDELLALAQQTEGRIAQLARSFETGQVLKAGVPVAIVGKTNVGKSTLLNRLLHDERAIVSDIHGTTRDTIEDTILLHDVPFRFIDTAGLRQTTDRVEQMGIQRTYTAIDRASIVVWVIDQQPTQEEQADMQQRTTNKAVIVVRNKIDQLSASPTDQYALPPSAINSDWPVLFISAKEGTNVAELEEHIYRAAHIPEIQENDIIITSARHYESLSQAADNLRRVIDGLHQHIPTDLIAEDLNLVLSDLADITGGAITSQETLNNIFSHFCVGK